MFHLRWCTKIPPPPNSRKSFADAYQATAAPPKIAEEAFPDLSTDDEISGHSLSGDEDAGESKSLEEQYAAAQANEDQTQEDEDPDEAEMAQIFKTANIRNVGSNAEAFLDATMGAPEDGEDEIHTTGYAGQGMHSERPRKATGSFESRQRKGGGARIAPYSGEE